MQQSKSYIKDTGHFLQKLRGLGKIPDNAILVTADVVGLYPSVPHEDGLKYLFEKLEERDVKKVSSEDLVEMAKFVLENNYFEFNSKVYQQISGTAIGTTFAPPYAYLFMDKVETNFLNSEVVKPWVWMRYIDDIFLSGRKAKKALKCF